MDPHETGSGGLKEGQMLWRLEFDVAAHFEGKGWWDVIEVRFRTDSSEGREHWHVPLLLSPWSYTTYRGS